MPSERSQKKGKDKWKEKTWYTILLPDFFGSKEVGSSPASGPESMVGRRIEVPVSDVTGNFKKGTSRLVLKVKSCEGSNCRTELVGHYVSDDSIRRMVRRRKERIDSYVRVATVDNHSIVIKVVIVADQKLTSARRADLRMSVERFLTDRISKLSIGDAALFLIGDEIYNEIQASVRNIYPVKKVEIRKSEISLMNGSPSAPVEEAITQ